MSVGAISRAARAAAPGGRALQAYARADLAARMTRAWAEAWAEHTPTHPEDVATAAALAKRLEGTPDARVRLGIAFAFAAWRRRRPWRWVPRRLQPRLFHHFRPAPPSGERTIPHGIMPRLHGD